MRTIRFGPPQRRALLSIALLVLPGLLHAQRRSSPVPTPEDILFADRVAMSASLEEALLGVTRISDVQRDTVQSLEQALRETIVIQGEAIRRTRRAANNRWPSEPELVERELNAIASARDEALARLRATLSREQRDRFDRNVRDLRDWDTFLWVRYAKPALGASALAGTTPQ